MNLDDLIPLVIVEAPAVPDVVAGYQVALSARDLCRFSLAWQSDISVTVDGSATYAFVPPDEGELVEPVSGIFATSVGASTSPLTPKAVAQLDRINPGWRTLLGSPSYYLLPDSETIQFVPNPPLGTATIRVALQPSLTRRVLDDRVGERYAEAIVHGALYRLFRMPAREWSDPKHAAYYEELFEREKSDAQVKGVDGFIKVARSVRYGGL